MYKLILIFFISLHANAASLTINLKDISSDTGELFIAIWNSEDGFPNDYTKAIATRIKPLQEPRHTFELPVGTYAVAAFQDENYDRTINRGRFGIPVEGFGFSNNPRLFLGPPSFQKASFELTENNKSIDIKFNYYGR